MAMIEIHQASSAEQINAVRELFAEYAASIGVSICFENLDDEIAKLPGSYSPPDGRLLIATYEGRIAGCVALKRIDDSVCEMKRLFVRYDFRGKGVGCSSIDDFRRSSPCRLHNTSSGHTPHHD